LGFRCDLPAADLAGRFFMVSYRVLESPRRI
jgi:hypothetical protein